MPLTQSQKRAADVGKAHIKTIMSNFKFLPTSERLVLEEIEDCLRELDNTKELSVVLQSLTFLYHGTVCFDFDHGDLSKSNKFEMCWFSSKQEEEILLQAVEVFSNKSEFLAVFALQLAHLCMAIVFKNNALPYYRSDPNRTRELEYVAIVEKMRNESQLDGKRVDSVTTSDLCGSIPSKWHQEIILIVPHLIAKNGYKEAKRIFATNQYLKELLIFYETHIIDEIQKFIADGKFVKSRQTVYGLNRKLGLLKLYQTSEFQFNTKVEVSLQDPTQLWAFSSSYPYLTFMRVAWTLNCQEPNNRFYEDNVFTDFEAFSDSNLEILSVFSSSKQCKTLFLVCPDTSDPGHLLDLLEKFFESNPQNKVMLIIVNKLYDIIEKQLAKGRHKIFFFQ